MGRRLRTLGITTKMLWRDIDDVTMVSVSFVTMLVTAIITILAPAGSWAALVFGATTVALLVGTFGYVIYDVFKGILSAFVGHVFRRYEQAQDQVRRESIKQCAIRDHGNGVGTTV